MSGGLTDDERREIDAQLTGEPIEPVLSLWEALSRVGGGMPPMEPDHVRVILLALRHERGKPASKTGKD